MPIAIVFAEVFTIRIVDRGAMLFALLVALVRPAPEQQQKDGKWQREKSRLHSREASTGLDQMFSAPEMLRSVPTVRAVPPETATRAV